MATDKLVEIDHVKDYISRQAAINIVCHDDCEDCPDGGCDMYRRMKRLPAADVRPVVRGKWEIDNSYAGPGLMNLRCSVCGEFGGTWKDNTLPSMLYNFCPHCGAEMSDSQTLEDAAQDADAGSMAPAT